MKLYIYINMEVVFEEFIFRGLLGDCGEDYKII